MDLRELNRSNQHRHPWELSRAKSILELIKDRLSDGRSADIGAGDLYFASELRKHSRHEVLAVDLFAPADASASGIKVVRRLDEEQADARFNNVFMLDVLEHVPDEDVFLQPVVERLTLDGTAVITVPAHQWLFTKHDEFLRHYRRYDMPGLVCILTRNGLEVEKTFYFYNSLFLVRALAASLEKLGLMPSASSPKGAGSWPFARKHVITKILESALNLDFRFCRKLSELGVKVPGLSLCVICKKKSV